MAEECSNAPAQEDRDPEFTLRDDNLRLLFSEAAKRELNERIQAINLGFVVLSAILLLGLTGWVVRLAMVKPQVDMPIFELLLSFDNLENFVISMMLLAAAILTTLSPVILFMLVTERRKYRREMKDLLSLLRRYGR